MSLRDAINVRKAFNQLKFKVSRSMPPYGTQAGRGRAIISRNEDKPVEALRRFLPYAHKYATIHGLSSRLDNLIEFRGIKKKAQRLN
jgi:hypothetical protein